MKMNNENENRYWLSSPHQFPPFAYQTSPSAPALAGRAMALGSLGPGRRAHLLLPVRPVFSLSAERRQPGNRGLLSQGLCSLQEEVTLSPSIAQDSASMGWILLPFKQCLTERPSVQSPTSASPLMSTSPSSCLPSLKWWDLVPTFHHFQWGIRIPCPVNPTLYLSSGEQ